MDGASTLQPGLDRPMYDSITVFRAVADAMAHPGRITPVAVRPPAPAQLMPAAAGLCLALLDFETPLWVQHPRPAVTDYLRFHCGCPLTDEPRHAAFALITDTLIMPALSDFHAGDAEYPERSATLFIQVGALSNACGVTLSGPGLPQPTQLMADGIALHHWRDIQASRTAFPCGVDIVFVAGEHIAALPRSTRIEC
jgi:alpha-D-ribose 1-methylphosphonate 5-triphosphate synthase subunit PhnH